MYRVRLGRSPSSTDIITNGTFTTDLSGWVAVSFVHSGNTAVSQYSTLGLAVLEQRNILELGKYYKLEFEVVAPFTALGVGYSWLREYKPYTTGVHSIEFQCTYVDSNSSLYFAALSDGSITNIKLYQMGFNPPLQNEPKMEIEYTLERDYYSEGVFTEAWGELEFYGDGYNYIYDNYSNDFCQEIPVLIEKLCNGRFTKYIDGVIYLSDVEFDLEKCTAKAAIENKFDLLFKNAKDSDVTINLTHTPTYFRFLPDTIYDITYHDRTGTHNITGRKAYRVYETLWFIIVYATNQALSYQSPVFGSGNFGGLMLSTGAEMRTAGSFQTVSGETITSFKEIFTELDYIFCIGWDIQEDANGVGVVTIDYKENFFGTTVILELENITNLKKYIAQQGLVRSVEIGYNLGETSQEGEIGKETISYLTDLRCNNEKLTLISKYVQNSSLVERQFPLFGINTSVSANQLIDISEDFGNVRQGDVVQNITDGGFASVVDVINSTTLYLDNDIFTGTGKTYRINGKDEFDDKLFIIEAVQTGVVTYESKVFANNSYNGNIDPDDNIHRWINTLSSSMYRDDTVYVEVQKTNSDKLILYSFDTVINDNDFSLIRSNKKEKVRFYHPQTGYIDGWIMTMTRSESGKSQLTIIKDGD